MVKILALGGIPASGKTTIARNLFGTLGFAENSTFRAGMLAGHYHPKYRVYILGNYGEGLFAGTDRLSMAVQPDAEKFIRYHAEHTFPEVSVFFEGDRLFNAKFLSFCKTHSTAMRALVLSASERAIRDRHEVRNDTQKAAFLKGRETKIRNIVSAFPVDLRVNETEFDSARIAYEIREFLLGASK